MSSPLMMKTRKQRLHLRLLFAILLAALSHDLDAFRVQKSNCQNGQRVRPTNASWLLPPRRRLTGVFVKTNSAESSPHHKGNAPAKRSGGNPAVQEMFQAVKERYPLDTASLSTINKEWTRFTGYLYKSKQVSLEQVIFVMDYLEELFPDESSLHISLLKTAPSILGRSVETYLRPTIEFLQSFYGRELFQEKVRLTHNLLLKPSPNDDRANSLLCSAEEEDKMEVYMQEYLGFSSSALAKLRRNRPGIFRAPIHTVGEVVAFLHEILEHGNYTTEEIKHKTAKIVILYPTMLQRSVPSSLRPRLKQLETDYFLSPKDMAKLLATKNGALELFRLSYSQNIRPTIDYLSSILSSDGTDGGDVKKCIMNFPGVVALALSNIQTKVDYFDTLDPPCLDDHGARILSRGLSAQVLKRVPNICSFNLLDRIMPKVEFLVGVWGLTLSDKRNDWANADLALNLRTFPSILAFSLEENLKPTLRFYNSTGYTALDSDWRLQQGSLQAINPRFLTASLWKRLLPRWFFAQSRSEAATSSIHMPPPQMPSTLLVYGTDAKFCCRYGATPVEFAEFKKKLIPLLKNSSHFDAWLKDGGPMDFVQPLLVSLSNS